MTDILNPEYRPLTLTKARSAADPTQAEFLHQAHGDLGLAFQFACAAVSRLARNVSHGYVRAIPNYAVRPPKRRVAPLLSAAEEEASVGQNQR